VKNKNGCKCIGCSTQDYYDRVRRKDTESVGFKQKKAISGENLLKSKQYKLILTDAGDIEGYSLQFFKGIDVFDAANVLAEYFDMEISIENKYESEIYAVDSE